MPELYQAIIAIGGLGVIVLYYIASIQLIDWSMEYKYEWEKVDQVEEKKLILPLAVCALAVFVPLFQWKDVWLGIQIPALFYWCFYLSVRISRRKRNTQ